MLSVAEMNKIRALTTREVVDAIALGQANFKAVNPECREELRARVIYLQEVYERRLRALAIEQREFVDKFVDL